MSVELDQINFPSTGHSATVEMTLYVGARAFHVLQSSGDAVKVVAGQNVPPGDAILETTVDGRLHRRLVRVLGSHSRTNWIDILDR